MAKNKLLMTGLVLAVGGLVGFAIGRTTHKEAAAQSYGLAQIPEQYAGPPALYGETATVPLHPRVTIA